LEFSPENRGSIDSELYIIIANMIVQKIVTSDNCYISTRTTLSMYTSYKITAFVTIGLVYVSGKNILDNVQKAHNLIESIHNCKRKKTHICLIYNVKFHLLWSENKRPLHLFYTRAYSARNIDVI
jgi:hypothetical protein